MIINYNQTTFDFRFGGPPGMNIGVGLLGAPPMNPVEPVNKHMPKEGNNADNMDIDNHSDEVNTCCTNTTKM